MMGLESGLNEVSGEILWVPELSTLGEGHFSKVYIGHAIWSFIYINALYKNMFVFTTWN